MERWRREEEEGGEGSGSVSSRKKGRRHGASDGNGVTSIYIPEARGDVGRRVNGRKLTTWSLRAAPACDEPRAGKSDHLEYYNIICVDF